MISRSEKANPYVGPRPFEREDADWFKGRSQEARDLLTLFLARRLVLLYAPSGAGKTSLLKAKLIPDLEKEEGFEVLPVGRVDDSITPPAEFSCNPFVFNLLVSLGIGDKPEVIAAAAPNLNHFLLNVGYDGSDFIYFDQAAGETEAEEIEEDSLTEDGETAVRPRALIIDQFEEIFTLHPELEAERIDFFRQLREAMLHDPYLYVMISMRGDYLYRIIPYVHLLPNSLRARFQLQRLRAKGAEEAVCEPAAEAGRPFDPDVAQELVECLRRVRRGERVEGEERPLGDFVEAMQLQVVCQQLWRRLAARPGPTISMADVEWVVQQRSTNETEQADSLELFVDNALADYYETALAAVLAHLHEQGIDRVDEYTLRRWFAKELITEAGTRDLLARMEDETKGLPEAAVAYLDKELYLIRNEIRAGNDFIELVHDSFVEPIRAANREWQAELERRIPWLDTARRYARNPNPELLLDDYDSLRAARKQMAREAEKGGLPPTTLQFLQSYLAQGEDVYQRRLSQEVPWLNSARQYAETGNPDLLFSGNTLQEARKQAAKAKARGGVPAEIDLFLEACTQEERRREKAQQEKELEQQRALAEAAEAQRKAEMERAMAHRRQAEAAEARHIAEKERAREAEEAEVRQRKLTRIAFGVGVLAVVLAIVAGLLGISARDNAATAETRAAQAVAAEGTATRALATAVVAQQEAADAQQEAVEAAATATDAQGQAEEEKELAQAAATRAKNAETRADALRLLNTAENALQEREFTSAILLSLAAMQRLEDNANRSMEDVIDIEDAAETLLLSALHQAYVPRDDAEIEKAFSALLTPPSEINVRDNLASGPLPGTLATLTENQMIYWPIQEPEQVNELPIPFANNTTSISRVIDRVVSPKGNRLALPFERRHIPVYSLLPERSTFLSLPSFSSNDRNLHLQKLAFSTDGKRLTAVFCTNNSGKPCQVDVWSTIDGIKTNSCSLDLLPKVTAVNFLNPNTILVAGSFKDETELLILSLRDSAADCAAFRNAVPEGMLSIEQLAYLPTDRILLSVSGRDLQWWRVFFENGRAFLERIGDLLQNDAPIIAIVPLIEQHAFVLLDQNQRLIWLNANSQLDTLANWGCETARRDLNADEWQDVSAANNVATFDLKVYEPVCAEYDYPLHISFAEQTLAQCDRTFSRDAAETFYAESEIGKEFERWAIGTLMIEFYEDELNFISNECWAFIEEEFSEEARHKLEPIAEGINELELQKNGLRAESYEDKLGEIRTSISDLAEYPDAFNQSLESQYQSFCFDRGFVRACRELAENLQFDAEPEKTDIGETTFWQLRATAGEIVSINMTAVDPTLTPYFELIDAEGNHLASGQPSANGRSAVLDSFVIPDVPEQPLLIQTRGAHGETSGAYQIKATQIEPGQLEIGTQGANQDLASTRIWQFSGEAVQENVATMQLIRIQIASTDQPSFTPYLTLLDGSGKEIPAIIGPDTGFSTFEATYLVAHNETYYVRAAGNNSNTEEQYTIRAEALDIPTIDIDNAPVTVTGNTDEQPIWSFSGEEGERITIAMNETDGSLDTVLVLYDADGRQIAFNDDSNNTFNSFIETTLPVEGEYFIHTRGYGGASGAYELTVRRPDGSP